MKKFAIVGQIFLIVLLIYSVLFSIVGTIFVFKAHSIIFEPINDIRAMKEEPPTMSRFMEDLVDSNPKVQIKQRYIPLDSISRNLQRAAIAAEDPGFYYHPGFDVRSIAWAMDANVSAGKILYGGSTITQQLAKNLFLTGERTWERKLKELGYAVVMEWELGKDRILEMYLNYAQWGKDIFGCEAASEAYYGVHCSELNQQQAINLAAMLASPCNHKPDEESSFLQTRRRNIQRRLENTRQGLP